MYGQADVWDVDGTGMQTVPDFKLSKRIRKVTSACTMLASYVPAHDALHVCRVSASRTHRCHAKDAATRLQLIVCRLQKVIGFVSAGAVATLFLVGGFCAIPL